MKPIVLCLVTCAILFSTGYGQSPRYQVGNGEYQNFILDNSTHILYGLGTAGNGIGTNTGQFGYSIPCQFPQANTQIKFVAAGLHTGACVDMNGNVYFTGANEDGSMGNGTTTGNSKGFVQVTTDSLGNAFTNVNYLAMGSAIFSGGQGYGACIYAVKNDGTLWVWGNTQGGYRGDGTYGRVNTRPVQVPFPAGTVITKVLIQNVAIALDAAGNVWTWAGNGPNNCLLGSTSRTNYMTPVKLSLPGPAKDIAGGGMWSYALLQSGNLYGWGLYQGYMGVGATASEGWTNTPAPILLDGQLNLPAQISQISCNKTSTYVILTDGTMWAWGGNECGQIGNGQEVNWAAYTTNPSPIGGTLTPYAWDWDMSNCQLQQHKPAQIGAGLKFVALSSGEETVFYKFAEDANGQLYSWGRNKAGVLGNGVMDADYQNGNIAATYPNSFDVPWITAINPINPTTPTIQSTSPYCISNPGANACNIYSIPANTPPVVNPGPNQNISTTSTTLDGSGSTDNVHITYYLWTQVSGPSTAQIVIPSGAKATVNNLVTGTYKFQLRCIDNGWMKDSAVVTVVVNGGGPTVNAGSNQTITLPTSSVSLTGSATDASGTISSYAWTQVSGPSTAAFANGGTGATTTASGLVQGTYVFKLTATDNNNISGNNTVTVTVNPAPVIPGPPSANAGSNQTITLPTNSVTLAGSGSETNGTIASYSWTQSSGPSTATISSSSAASTTASGLVQGAYTFKLTVTDALGITASATVTVTVDAPVPGPPVANAGTNQTITLPTNRVTLTGSGSETNGTIASYSWTQVSGPSTATIASSSAASTAVSGLVQGAYTFKLTVTDGLGITASATVTVTVNAPAAGAPSANAGSDQTITLPTNSATLTGSGSETNGTITGYSWTQASGPSTAAIGSASSASTTVSGLVKGTYIFTLTVTDNSGVTASDNVTVTVNPAPVTPGAPSANAGNDQTITLPTNHVSLTGSGAETNGTITGYSWTQASGPSTASISASSSASTTMSGLVQGVYVFTLTVTDNSGVTASDNVTVTVNPAPPGPPSANAGSNQTITLPTNSVTLTGSGSETNGTITGYSWTQASGPSTATLGGASAASTTVGGLVQGTYTFKLTVTDNSGVTASATVTVTVNPAPVTPGPPSANAGSNQTITLPTNSVTLTGSGSETNGTITGYSWTETGGPSTATIGSASSASTTAGGLVAGTYTFKLTVTDNSGVTASATVTVTVNPTPKPQPPVAVPGPNQTVAQNVTSVQLNGSGSYSPGGTIVGYDWAQISGLGGVTIANSTTATPSIYGLEPGTYTFQLTVTDNFGATASATMTVTVTAASTATLVANAGVTDTLELPNNIATLNGSASTVSSGTITGYVWKEVSGPSTVTITSPDNSETTVSGFITGTYTFQLTVTDNSGDTASATVNVVVLNNLQRSSNTTSVSLYPNPTQSMLNVVYTSSGQGKFTMSVYSTSGVDEMTGTYEQEGGTATYQLNVSSLARGTYILVIRTSTGHREVRKFVKQ